MASALEVTRSHSAMMMETSSEHAPSMITTSQRRVFSMWEHQSDTLTQNIFESTTKPTNKYNHYLKPSNLFRPCHQILSAPPVDQRSSFPQLLLFMIKTYQNPPSKFGFGSWHFTILTRRNMEKPPVNTSIIQHPQPPRHPHPPEAHV